MKCPACGGTGGEQEMYSYEECDYCNGGRINIFGLIKYWRHTFQLWKWIREEERNRRKK